MRTVVRHTTVRMLEGRGANKCMDELETQRRRVAGLVSVWESESPMSTLRRACLVAWILVLGGCGARGDGSAPTEAETLDRVSGALPTASVDTRYGPVVGISFDGVHVFRGIPYAAPPMGEHRWRPPKPPTPWIEPLQAERFGAACPQQLSERFPAWAREHLAHTGISEDCLTLNIWRPAELSAGALPVMVHIHGSSWKYASSSWPLWTGDSLAREGVIVVSFNYRLGLLGRFAHPALSRAQAGELLANYATMDQIAALEWVRDNIASFGGDPGNVTLFGHSAGGTSVAFLMVTPRSEGLFHRAIVQSGGVLLDGSRRLSELGPEGPVRASMEQVGLEMAKHFGIRGSDSEIVAALRALQPQELVDYLPTETLLNPVVDGDLIPDDIARLFEQGRQHAVPFISGATSWEWNQIARPPLIAKWFMAGALLEGLGAEDLKPLPRSWTRVGASQQWFNNGVFFTPMRFLAKMMGRTQAPAWHYHVTYQQTAIRGSYPGAPHGLDVRFLFGHLKESPEFNSPEPIELSQEDLRFGNTLRTYWLNFARTGDPNGAGLPHWPRFDPAAGSDLTLELGSNIQTRENLKQRMADALERRALARRARFESPD